MKRQKLKQYITANGVAGVWLAIYIAVQSFVMIGVMTFHIYTNEKFADDFLVTFEPIVAMENWFEKQMKTMEGLLHILSKQMSAILLISSLLTSAIVIMWARRKKQRIIGKLTGKEVSRYVLIGLGINLLLTILVDCLPSNIYSTMHETVESSALSGGIWMDVLATGVCVPICEELIFRFGVLRGLQRFSTKYAIVYQAFLFGVLHANLIQSTYAFFLGLYFGYMDEKRGNISVSVLLHIVINLSSVLVGYWTGNDIKQLMIVGVLSLFVYIGFEIDFLKKKE